MVTRFRPEEPLHDRYAVSHDFLTAETGTEVVTIGRLINAFFRWEFNSCECLVRGDDVFPIDYANACPDIGLTSLHYYFPWAVGTLVKWCLFCVVTGRQPRLDLDPRRYFAIGDRDDLSYAEKLEAYRRLADDYFETERYADFCQSSLAGLDLSSSKLSKATIGARSAPCVPTLPPSARSASDRRMGRTINACSSPRTQCGTSTGSKTDNR